MPIDSRAPVVALGGSTPCGHWGASGNRVRAELGRRRRPAAQWNSLLVVGALCALATVLSCAPAAAEGRTAALPRCAVPAGAKELASSRHALVYRTRPKVTGTDQERDTDADLIGCWRKTRRLTSLGEDYNHGEGAYVQSSGHLTLAGRYVALTLSYYDKYQEQSDEIDVWDLSAGRARYCLPTTYGLTAAGGKSGPAGLYYVDALVINNRGAIAWQEHHEMAPATARISAYDADGRRVLDSGGPGAYSSLSLRSNALSWRSAGAPRSASLHGMPKRHPCY
jgi:hypothetical protein